MRRAALLGLLALSGLAAVRAADPPRLPVRPFLLAEEGDWATGVVTTRLLTRSNAADLPERASTWRIAKVGTETVTVTIEEPPGVFETRLFPRRGEPLIEDWIGQRGRTFSDVKAEDDERTWDGRDLPCKRVRFRATGGGLPAQRFELWFSRHVRGPGLIGWSVVEERADDRIEGEFELRGHGNGGLADAGITPPEGPAPVASHVTGTIAARVCDSCAIRFANRCLACDGHGARDAATLCRKCDRGRGACARCPSPFGTKPAFLCFTCSVGGKKELCARCSHGRR